MRLIRQRIGRFLAAFGIVAAVGVPPADAAENEAAPSVQRLDASLKLLDAAGNIHSIQPRVADETRVFVFLMGECPVSSAYVPELNRLWPEWKKTGTVSLTGVWADADSTPAQVAEFAKTHEIEFPILLDRDQQLGRLLQPTHVPEAFVLDRDGRVTYRGRIDDSFPALGQPRRPEPSKRDLAVAVQASLKGTAIAPVRTEPVGCFYDSAPPAAKPQVTYTRDIAPILFANCLICHREGEVGPFPLTDYNDAAKRGDQLVEVTRQKIMPPWMPRQAHGEFEDQRILTAREIELIAAWNEGGRAEGKVEDLPTPPAFGGGWPLGEPDLIVEMPQEFSIPADGPDLFQNFVIPITLDRNRRVAAVDFRPGNPRVVHHSILYLDYNGVARAKDAKSPEPGYRSFGGPGFAPSGSMGGWSPGKTPRRLPDGMGRFIRKESDLVMQVHYHPTGKPEKDRSRVAVYFADGQGKLAADIWAARHDLNIPPGEKNYRVESSFVLSRNATMLGVVPHMHLIGREMTGDAILPDGQTIRLFEIPEWNFNWQDDYRFAQPLHLPAGTMFKVKARYDNSEENPSNPSSPPRRVKFGEGTYDEMLYCFFLVAGDTNADLGRMENESLIREGVSRSLATGRVFLGE